MDGSGEAATEAAPPSPMELRDATPQASATPSGFFCPGTHVATVRSWRDATTEEELFVNGALADAAFRFSSDGLQAEWVYSFGGVLAVVSPVLKEVILEWPGGSDSHTTPSGRTCRTVLLHPEITARAFREVVRYAHGLPAQWTPTSLPEVLMAARLLHVPELEDLASGWGLDVISGETLPDDVPDGCCSCEDALCSFERLCSMEPRPADVPSWREAILAVYPAEQILAAAIDLELSPCTFRELLEGEALHVDAVALWQAAVKWAHVRAGHQPSFSVLRSLMSSSRSPFTMASVELPPQDLRQGPPPRRLFGRGARLCRSLAPPEPGEDEVAWQEPLLEVVDRVRFQDMSAAAFAGQVEALGPVLPRLRQEIYASRRRAAREAGSPAAEPEAAEPEAAEPEAAEPEAAEPEAVCPG